MESRFICRARYIIKKIKNWKAKREGAMKKAAAIILAIILAGSIAGTPAKAATVVEETMAKAMVKVVVEQIEGGCSVYSSAVYSEEYDAMVLMVSMWELKYMPPELVKENRELFYSMYETMNGIFKEFMDCNIVVLLQEMDTQRWMIDEHGIYDCESGTIVHQRKQYTGK